MSETATRTGAGVTPINLACTANPGRARGRDTAAWVRHYEQLPPQLRGSSAISAVALAAVAALEPRRASSWGTASTPARMLTWVLVQLLALTAPGNFAAASRWDNLLMGPLAMDMSVQHIVTARCGQSHMVAATL